MRYAQGGGLTDERRYVREKLRMEAAERFRQGDENPVIAHDLRVSVRSVQRWRRAWSQNGPRALASKGPASLPLLSDELFAALERELARGPVAHGRPDQTWTLSRIKTLIGRRFHKSYTVQGVAGWVKETWPSVEGPWRRSTPGSSSRTRPDSR
ncbi:helix-turn-helix domain-containing protein [Streptomyces sp. CL12]|uniref:helix-turn-helix domain-containing protein n=1 Tax=Streptomyces sp. CL12 TaxID=3391744 RepID=UPI003A7FBB86